MLKRTFFCICLTTLLHHKSFLNELLQRTQYPFIDFVVNFELHQLRVIPVYRLDMMGVILPMTTMSCGRRTHENRFWSLHRPFISYLRYHPVSQDTILAFHGNLAYLDCCW